MTLDDFSRTPLMFGPSPIHPLPRLSEALGGEVEIWAKGGDCNSGIAFGGNKVRKLEYLVAEALERGCDTLVSIGGIQSNHTRQVTGVARHLGLGAVTVQEGRVDWPEVIYDRVGNIQLTAGSAQVDPGGHDHQHLAQGGDPQQCPVRCDRPQGHAAQGGRGPDGGNHHEHDDGQVDRQVPAVARAWRDRVHASRRPSTLRPA